jgi:hypothetical protein
MVGPGRSSPLHADSWPAVPFLHSVRAAAIRPDGQEETTEGIRMQQRHKE